MMQGCTNYFGNLIRKSILNPDRSKRPPEHFKNPHYTNIKLKTKDDVYIGCYLYEPVVITEKTKFFIFLHGVGVNREDISEIYKLNLFTIDSFLMIPDYREFGDSEGTFSISTVNFDILACFEYLVGTYNAKNIIALAMSFGTAIISEYVRFVVANDIHYDFQKDTQSNPAIPKSNTDPKSTVRNINSLLPDKIFLLAPFSSLSNIVSDYKILKYSLMFLKGARKYLEEHLGYNTAESLKYFDNKKVFVYHGIKDSIIPYSHSLEIHKKINCVLYLNKTDHHETSNSMDVWKDIKKKVFPEP